MAAVDFHRKSNSIIHARVYIRGLKYHVVRFRGILFPFLSLFSPSLPPFFPPYSHRETIRHYVNRCWFESPGSKRVRSSRYSAPRLEDKALPCLFFFSNEPRRSNENRAKRRGGSQRCGTRNVREPKRGKSGIRFFIYRSFVEKPCHGDPRRFEGEGEGGRSR